MGIKQKIIRALSLNSYSKIIASCPSVKINPCISRRSINQIPKSNYQIYPSTFQQPKLLSARLNLSCSDSRIWSCLSTTRQPTDIKNRLSSHTISVNPANLPQANFRRCKVSILFCNPFVAKTILSIVKFAPSYAIPSPPWRISS